MLKILCTDCGRKNAEFERKRQVRRRIREEAEANKAVPRSPEESGLVPPKYDHLPLRVVPVEKD